MNGVLKLCVLLWLAASARCEALPDAATVLKRMQARLEELCAQPATNRLYYSRTNVLEEMDSGGKIKKRSEKLYTVALMHGLPRAKLVAIDGRRLSESEQRWRSSDEQRLQRTLTQDKAPDYSKPKPWLTDDLLERFQFTVVGRTNQQQRSVLMLKFEPRPEAPTRNMADRIVNKVFGALWIDELESEIVLLRLQMNEPVKFWGGILGQLDRFEWSLRRTRSPLGAWFNQQSSGLFQIRKLLSTTRYRFVERSSPLTRTEPL
jgi:hypothetical protein